MRLGVVLVIPLYLIAAYYGYSIWSASSHSPLEAQTSQAATIAKTLEPARLSVVDTKNEQHLIKQQLQNLQASLETRLAQLEFKQDAALKSLQAQLDDLKKQQNQDKLATSSTPITPATEGSNPVFSNDSSTEAQQLLAKQSLATRLSQLDLKLQTDTPDIGRQSMLQQKLEAALTQTELTNVIQSHTECGQVFCKLDLKGQAPEGVDALQALWEQNVFPESTEVMTIPKPDGSGWLVYIAADGKSLANMP